MDEASVFAFARLLVIDYKRHVTHGKWINISCPLAPWYHAKGTDNNPSFGITVDPDGKSYYRCLSCNSKGTLASLAYKLGKLRGKDYSKHAHWAEHVELQATAAKPLRDWDEIGNDVAKQVVEHVPDPSDLEAYPLALGVPYLRRRGIMYDDVMNLGLRYDSFQQRVLFPVYDDLARFRGFTGRSVMAEELLTKKNPKVRDYFGLKKDRLFLSHKRFHKTIDTVDGIYGRQILVEGLFGYASMVVDGFVNTIANLGTALTEEKVRILIERGLPLYLFFDNDKAGEDAVLGNLNNDTGGREYFNGWAHRLFESIPVWICQYPKGTDGQDPHDLTKEQRLWAVEHAKMYSTSHLNLDTLPW